MGARSQQRVRRTRRKLRGRSLVAGPRPPGRDGAFAEMDIAVRRRPGTGLPRRGVRLSGGPGNAC